MSYAYVIPAVTVIILCIIVWRCLADSRKSLDSLMQAEDIIFSLRRENSNLKANCTRLAGLVQVHNRQLADARKDTEALDHLREIFRQLPHARLTYREEEGEEDSLGEIPAGWAIRMDGCNGTLTVKAESFRALLRKQLQS